jgi:hypothetical protein
MGERRVTSERKPDRSKMALAGGLAVIFAAVTVRTFSSGPDQAVAAPEPAQTSAPVSLSRGQQAAPPPRAIDWPSGAARDPFASALVYRPVVVVKPDEPAPPPPPPPKDLIKEATDAIPVTATVLGDRPLAMINGRIYRVGEIVAGFHIVDIQARRIVVERDNQQIPIDVTQ